MTEFAPDHRTKEIATLLAALFRDVLHEEEPFFISDEATLLDVSLVAPDELIGRCSAYYRTTVTVADLRTPLWKVLPELAQKRLSARDPP